jgi:hypothetical protein
MAVNNGSSVRKMKRAENTPWQRTKVRNVTSIGRQDKSLAAAKSSLGARAERRLATAKGASGGESKKEIKPEPLTREQGIQENERKSAGTKTSRRAEWENRGSGVGKAGASDRKDETDRERLAWAGMKNEAGAQLTRRENPEKIISTEKAKILHQNQDRKPRPDRRQQDQGRRREGNRNRSVAKKKSSCENRKPGTAFTSRKKDQIWPARIACMRDFLARLSLQPENETASRLPNQEIKTNNKQGCENSNEHLDLAKSRKKKMNSTYKIQKSIFSLKSTVL